MKRKTKMYLCRLEKDFTDKNSEHSVSFHTDDYNSIAKNICAAQQVNRGRRVNMRYLKADLRKATYTHTSLLPLLCCCSMSMLD